MTYVDPITQTIRDDNTRLFKQVIELLNTNSELNRKLSRMWRVFQIQAVVAVFAVLWWIWF